MRGKTGISQRVAACECNREAPRMPNPWCNSFWLSGLRQGSSLDLESLHGQSNSFSAWQIRRIMLLLVNLLETWPFHSAQFGHRFATNLLKEPTMSDVIHDTHQEFWRPPVSQPATNDSLAEACRRCGTEFMVGAAFCHICGSGRHRSSGVSDRNWTKYFGFLRALDFSSVTGWFGLPMPSLCAFLVGSAFLVVALAMGFVSVHDMSDFEAVQLWRIQWLMAACAAFLAGILLKNRKSES